MTFGMKLKQMREALGLSQADLAYRSGLHPQSVAKLEQGSREPSFFTVKAIAGVLGASVSAFEDTVKSNDDEPSQQPPGKVGRPKKPTADESKQPDAPPPAPPAKKGRAKKGGA
jgi:transcriptional regulator with XRE-family HTH domain